MSCGLDIVDFYRSGETNSFGHGVTRLLQRVPEPFCDFLNIPDCHHRDGGAMPGLSLQAFRV